MRPTTLCFPVSATGEILLGRKKRGFGVSKWNGFGGKVEKGETFRACAVRELFEEAHLTAREQDLQLQAFLDFRFPAQPELNHIGYVYLLRKWHGEVWESEEMKPCWFAADDLPYNDMWRGDRLWIPMIQSGRTISGTIVFADDNDHLANSVFSDVQVLKEPKGIVIE